MAAWFTNTFMPPSEPGGRTGLVCTLCTRVHFQSDEVIVGAFVCLNDGDPICLHPEAYERWTEGLRFPTFPLAYPKGTEGMPSGYAVWGVEWPAVLRSAPDFGKFFAAAHDVAPRLVAMATEAAEVRTPRAIGAYALALRWSLSRLELHLCEAKRVRRAR